MNYKHCLDADQSTISQQLARLRNGNLVDTRKEGTTVYYSVRDPMIFQLMDVAREIFNRQLISHQELLQQVSEEVDVLSIDNWGSISFSNLSTRKTHCFVGWRVFVIP